MKKKYLRYHLLAFISAVFLFLIVNPHNVGFSPDSLAYLEVAQNIEAGRGIVDDQGKVVDHWPPAFPFAIFIVSKLSGLSNLEAGVVLQPVLLYCTLMLFLFIMREARIHNKLIILGGILLAFSQLIKNYLWYLSEGLFIVFLLISFFLLLKWSKEKKSEYLMYMGFACGLLFLTRYAGVSFIASFCLFLIWKSEDISQGIKRLFIYLFSLFVIVSPWFLFLTVIGGNPSGRDVAIHLISFSKITDFFITVVYWFLGSIWARAFFIVLVLLYFYYFWIRKISILSLFNKGKQRTDVIIASVLIVLIYPLFLIFSISFYDAWTPLDNRILSPIFPFVLLLLMMALEILKQSKFKILFYSTIVFLLISLSSSTLPSFWNHFENGNGYTKNQWKESPLISYLKKKDHQEVIYSNGIEFGKLYVGRNFKILPLNSNDLNFSKMKKDVYNGKAKIVYFNNVDWRNYLTSKEKICREFDDLNFLEFSDGFIVQKSTSE